MYNINPLIIFLSLFLVFCAGCKTGSPSSPDYVPVDQETKSLLAAYDHARYALVMNDTLLKVMLPYCSKVDGKWKKKASQHLFIATRSDAETLVLNVQSTTIEDTSDSGEGYKKNVDFFIRFIRKSGYQLYGVWKYDSTWVLHDAPLSARDSMRIFQIQENVLNRGYHYIRIDSSAFTIYSADSTAEGSFSHMYHKTWNRHFSTVRARFDSLDRHTVRLIGAVTGDTVIISRDSWGSIQTRGTLNGEYHEYTCDPYTDDCPYKEYPEWLMNDFFLQNQ